MSRHAPGKKYKYFTNLQIFQTALDSLCTNMLKLCNQELSDLIYKFFEVFYLLKATNFRFFFIICFFNYHIKPKFAYCLLLCLTFFFKVFLLKPISKTITIMVVKEAFLKKRLWQLPNDLLLFKTKSLKTINYF